MFWSVESQTVVFEQLPSEKQQKEPTRLGLIDAGTATLAALLPPIGVVAASGLLVQWIAHLVHPALLLDAGKKAGDASDEDWLVGWSSISTEKGEVQLKRVKTAIEEKEAQDARATEKARQRAEKTERARRKLQKYDAQLKSLHKQIDKAVAVEDYSRAKEIQGELTATQSKREAYNEKFVAWRAKDASRANDKRERRAQRQAMKREEEKEKQEKLRAVESERARLLKEREAKKAELQAEKKAAVAAMEFDRAAEIKKLEDALSATPLGEPTTTLELTPAVATSQCVQPMPTLVSSTVSPVSTASEASALKSGVLPAPPPPQAQLPSPPQTDTRGPSGAAPPPPVASGRGPPAGPPPPPPPPPPPQGPNVSSPKSSGGGGGGRADLLVAIHNGGIGMLKKTKTKDLSRPRAVAAGATLSSSPSTATGASSVVAGKDADTQYGPPWNKKCPPGLDMFGEMAWKQKQKAAQDAHMMDTAAGTTSSPPQAQQKSQAHTMGVSPAPVAVPAAAAPPPPPPPTPPAPPPIPSPSSGGDSATADKQGGRDSATDGSSRGDLMSAIRSSSVKSLRSVSASTSSSSLDSSVERGSPSAAGPYPDSQRRGSNVQIAPQALNFLHQLQQRQSQKATALQESESENSDDDTSSDDGGWSDGQEAEDAVAAARMAQSKRAAALGVK